MFSECIRGDEEKHLLLMEATPKQLPWKSSVKFTTVTDTGYFYPTIIQQSLMENVGRARFNQTPIEANSAICRKKIINVSSNELFTPDKAIVFCNEKYLNQLIGRFMYECNESFENIIDGITNFAGTLDGQSIYLWTQSGYYNHSTTNHNIQTTCDNTYYYIKSTKYIANNSELCLNYYNEMEFPSWYLNFCAKYKVNGIPSFLANTANVNNAKSKL
eukprot:442600_1